MYLVVHELEKEEQVVIFPPVLLVHDHFVVVYHEVVNGLGKSNAIWSKILNTSQKPQ